ncbi:hypothetical protein SK854_45935 [Lentzea sp. BCCO 10_0061]|uniref:Uncharacterized protein n=1 Tax=Lentzea sokolovensis TaxID=3095429 RepID=A0ABU4VCJ4_9PSEU|nr:hypothetical protein [Lentzea sp. BCCO 10_0061]MDX8149532.1 hypothetical protein [Lentzea sp. BCCO 10_0061]
MTLTLEPILRSADIDPSDARRSTTPSCASARTPAFLAYTPTPPAMSQVRILPPVIAGFSSVGRDLLRWWLSSQNTVAAIHRDEVVMNGAAPDRAIAMDAAIALPRTLAAESREVYEQERAGEFGRWGDVDRVDRSAPPTGSVPQAVSNEREPRQTEQGEACDSVPLVDDYASSRRFRPVQQVHPFVVTSFAVSQNEGASGSLFTPSSAC